MPELIVPYQFILLMNVSIITSIINSAVVLVIGIATVIINRRTLKNERIKIQTAIEQSYVINLLEERSKLYPDVYMIVSELAMEIAAMQNGQRDLVKPVTKERLLKAREKFDCLKGGHALFYSVKTAYAVYDFYQRLSEIIESLKKDNDIIPHSILDEFRTKISLAEMGLKKDLGVPIEEFQSIRWKYKGTDYKDFKN